MTAPPITNDNDAQLRALIWQPFDDQQPLTVTTAYLLDLLQRAGAMPDGYKPWGAEHVIQASGYDDVALVAAGADPDEVTGTHGWLYEDESGVPR